MTTTAQITIAIANGIMIAVATLTGIYMALRIIVPPIFYAAWGNLTS